MDVLKLLTCIVLFIVASTDSFEDEWYQHSVVPNLQRFASGINSFGFEFFQKLIRDKGAANVFVCPFSVANILSILHVGVVGKTEQELGDALGYTNNNITKLLAAELFYHLKTRVFISSDPKRYSFNSTSSILLHERVELDSTFQRAAETLYQLPLTVVDFSSRPERIIKDIKDWVSARMKTSFGHLIQKIDPAVDLIVLDSVYFKCVWKHRFSWTDTGNGLFYNEGRNTPKKVFMMSLKSSLRYRKTLDYSLLELPFRTANLSMIILFPAKRDGLKKLERRFSSIITEGVPKLRNRNIHLKLPLVKFYYQSYFAKSLKEMGVVTLFDSDSRRFSDMFRQPDLVVGDMQHNTRFSLNEDGINILLQTDVRPLKSAIFKKFGIFEINHPFQFVILDKRTGLFLFMGRVKRL